MGRIDCAPTFLSLGNNVKWIHRRVLSLLEYKEIIIQENCIAVLNSVVGCDQEMRSRLKVFYKTKITRVSSEYCAYKKWVTQTRAHLGSLWYQRSPIPQTRNRFAFVCNGILNRLQLLHCLNANFFLQKNNCIFIDQFNEK